MVATLLILVLSLGETILAQEPRFFEERHPADLFWLETLVGTAGAYLGGLAGAYSGALIGGCFAEDLNDPGWLSSECLLSALVGGLIGSTIGATASIALTAGFYSVEGSIFLSLVGASGGEVVGLLITAYLVPPTVPSLVSWIVPSMTSSLFASMGFNVGAKFREATALAPHTVECLQCRPQAFFIP
jgi:hypothetical protein